MKQIEIISGNFYEGETVTVRILGREFTRKVRYSARKWADLYITINGCALTYEEISNPEDFGDVDYAELLGIHLTYEERIAEASIEDLQQELDHIKEEIQWGREYYKATSDPQARHWEAKKDLVQKAMAYKVMEQGLADLVRQGLMTKEQAQEMLARGK